jgi:polygalacturonase
LIENCNIADGDDNIAIGGTSSSSNITVTNDHLGIGHGLSIGSYTSGGVNGLTVSGITFAETTSGIRIKSADGRGGLVQYLSYSNLTMTDVQNPIFITGYYPNLPSSAASSPAGTTTELPNYQNISISNLTSTNNASNGNEGIIWGISNLPINGLTLTNVNISAKTGMDIYYANNVQLVGDSLTIANEYDAQVTVVPEPASCYLLGSALVYLAFYFRRRMRALA